MGFDFECFFFEAFDLKLALQVCEVSTGLCLGLGFLLVFVRLV